MFDQTPRILYVDDDPGQLTAFRAAFRRDATVFTGKSAEEGLEILKREELDIILTDQRMPGITGVHFLESITSSYPDLIKILITGYTDMQDVIDAINKGKIYCYLNKPWDEQNLRVILRNAFDMACTRRLLKERNLQLQKTNNELEKFVYSASHDLRAPLMSIKGIINFAKTQPNTTPQDYLAMIDKSIDRLDVFVGNIINYYQNVKYEIRPSVLDFDKMIRETWASFDYFQGKSNIQLKYCIDQQEAFSTDEFRFQVILNNILLNAIKYQNKNRHDQFVSIDLKVAQKNATLCIEDSGIGIESEHLDKIFNMFYRATQEKPGSGLGLYIAKEAVEKIGGEIEVSSVIGKGTKFKIVIPNQA
ncbi:MAG: hybrid sensor histidine kinase/response regulator [Bacteroidia bacterium]